MTQKIDDFHLAVWRSFLNAHAAVINEIEKEMAAAHQLPLSSYDVLVALTQAPDHRLRMFELADRVVLSRSGLTRLVDRLELDGLLTRDRSGSDRRGAFAVLTEKGFQAVRQAWPIYARGIMQHFTNHLDDHETEVLTRAFERIFNTARQPQNT